MQVLRPRAELNRVRFMIKIGEKVPSATLSESVGYDETSHCPTGPVPVEVSELTKGKTVVFFGLPGAFTPTCSGQHVPGYVKLADDLKKRGVDEIVCLSVNDGFVMGAWGRDQNVTGKVRMLGDGSADFTKKLGLELDLVARGMGIRCQRFSMLVVDGVVKSLNVEGPGAFEVSNAETMLKQVS
jgi:glutaredoxin/glutathione-dependent peroxiredoxin